MLDPGELPRHCRRMNDPVPDIATMSFEDALKGLEEIVRQLESGEVPLDESLSLYERGEALRRHCQARLDAAQARIEQIVQGADGQAAGTRPFDAAER
jgi:exodeoxyribonuclease VII small subunit